MAWLTKVDHVTYACARDTIEKWAWFHIEVEGGTLIRRIDDVRPDALDSSMKLWCIDYGDFGVALVEGIDRLKKSQVTQFVERHGDHACQHVAYACRDLEEFRGHLERMGGRCRGETLVRNDGFGTLKQMFAKGYSTGNAGESTFPEYLERPEIPDAEGGRISFSRQAGQGFYDQIAAAVDAVDEQPVFDFAAVPAHWRPPEPRPGHPRSPGREPSPAPGRRRPN
ncbi:hypothetical protein J2Z21_008770 [Streptomyces griseochromogenes]|uniref:VOC domain-containing protein n=1 Tax=Streptomyces griseochromogenes TaxID=68214 RepID=A0A1B1B0J5_9ACTN|nr:hypothetical protein [Streptomyces griseochromogenes]ANP52337.1 hypothetical protein AVL59_24820 [Streptomyces griseochromogenes]MBP2055754.1 hypothetical protein [Streptomyces griseochromogenes]